jgi:hypothetical protein
MNYGTLNLVLTDLHASTELPDSHEQMAKITVCKGYKVTKYTVFYRILDVKKKIWNTHSEYVQN